MVFIPFITRRSSPETQKGGGGGPKGGSGPKGGGSSGGGGVSGAAGASGLSGRGSFSTGSSSGTPRTANSYSNGGGTPSVIPSGSLFAGRSQGGGARSDIYGTKQYGSGYPGVAQRGVAGRAFPFVFWPVMFGGGLGYGSYYASSSYLHSREYGDAKNSSRPGGPLTLASFQPNPPNSTYFILSDNNTVHSLIDDIVDSCTLYSNSSSYFTIPYDPDAPENASNPNYPKPESVIQYYRASSIALVLRGYNNSADVSGDDDVNGTKVPDTPLPSGLDLNFLACLNGTIGDAAPLVDAGVGLNPSNGGLLLLVWAVAVAVRSIL